VSRDVTFEEEVAFRRSRGSHMEIDSERQEEMVPSPPHPPTVQREIFEPIDPIDIVDPVAQLMFQRYCSRLKETCMGSSDFVGGIRTCNSSWYLPREQDTSDIFVLCCNYEPHH
jgi:hypothetical protein